MTLVNCTHNPTIAMIILEDKFKMNIIMNLMKKLITSTSSFTTRKIKPLNLHIINRTCQSMKGYYAKVKFMIKRSFSGKVSNNKRVNLHKW